MFCPFKGLDSRPSMSEWTFILLSFQNSCPGSKQYWGWGIQYTHQGDDPVTAPQPPLPRVCQRGTKQPQAEVGRWQKPRLDTVLPGDASGQRKVRGVSKVAVSSVLHIQGSYRNVYMNILRLPTWNVKMSMSSNWWNCLLLLSLLPPSPKPT